MKWFVSWRGTCAIRSRLRILRARTFETRDNPCMARLQNQFPGSSIYKQIAPLGHWHSPILFNLNRKPQL